MPVISQEVKKSTMRNSRDVSIPAHVAGEVTQGAAGLAGAGGELGEGGLKRAVLALVGPDIADAGGVDLGAELGRQPVDGGANVAARGGHLLEDVEGDDGVEPLAADGVDAGVEGAAHGRGGEVGELVVGREGLADGGALGEAELGEVRVVDGLVLEREVVDALGVADEMDGWSHDGE